MNVIRHTEIAAHATPGGNHTSALASPTRGATDVCIYRQWQEAGGQNPPHYHDREEVLVLQAGAVRITIDGEPADLEAGDVLIIPANTVHSLATVGTEASEWLIVARAGLRFFRPDGEEVFAEWAR